MKRSEFKIGLVFYTCAGRWRCTDVGSRIITAIKLDEYADESWYDGPPYAIIENVFDEYGMADCKLVQQGEQ